MKILIVSQYFYPENFRINDLAFELKKRDHQVSVLTGTPNYPGGSFFKGYGFFKKNFDIINGVKIYRSPLVPRMSGSNFKLSINYISFIFGAIIRSLFIIKNKYDIIFVFEPSPITVCLPAIFIKKIKKIPICFWVLDLWPESVVSAGNLKSKLIPKVLNPIVRYIYKKSDKILVSSNGFKKSIVSKGIDANKIEFFPQWAEDIFKPKVKMKMKNFPKDAFIVMFAGNIGEAQDFPSILNAAIILKDNKNIHWVIIGSGRKEKWVKNKIIEYGLESCFHLMGRHPIEKMPKLYSYADCMLFSLKNEYIFSITIPAKVQTYLACAKPVVAMINGEAASLIEETKSGLVSPSENPELLAKNIKKLSLISKNDLNDIGKNSYKCYEKYFERTMLISKLEIIFKSL